jgi:hypothetical protein
MRHPKILRIKVVIPRGWRRVGGLTVLKLGDLYSDRHSREWRPVNLSLGYRKIDTAIANNVVIRRRAKR